MVLGGGALDYNGVLSYCDANPSARPCAYLYAVDPDAVHDHAKLRLTRGGHSAHVSRLMVYFR